MVLATDKLEFIMEGYRPPSTNDCYIPTSRRTKCGPSKGAYLRKSGWLVEWQEKVTEMINSEFHYSKDELKEFVEDIKSTGKGMTIEIVVSMPKKTYGTHKLEGIDASNFIKAIEDSIHSNIGIDDRFNTDVIARKRYNEDDKWIVKVTSTKTDSCWMKDSIIDEGSKVYEFK